MRVIDALPLALAFGLSLALTPAVRILARNWGAVVLPRPGRWHHQATAKFGGVAIFLAVVVAALATPVHAPWTLPLLAGGGFLWLVGLIDDLCYLRPYQKLLGQAAGAAGLIAFGYHLPWTPWPLVNAALTLLWVVGITNALNLLDNMDGLAAGVASIAAAFLAVHRLADGQPAVALLLGVLAAALAGFLAYNRQPASIFMGDSGALFIGYLLAGSALCGADDDCRPVSLAAAAVPVLALALPIFDVTLVTVLRSLAGRSPFQGGCDHTSHRLVALGLSERWTVRLLYALTVLSGAMSLAVRSAPAAAGLLVLLAFTAAFAALGFAVAPVRVYTSLPRRWPAPRRALIYGAGEAGLLLLQVLRDNPDLGSVPVGFADDDPRRKGQVVQGLEVLGGNGQLVEICRACNVAELHLATDDFSAERFQEIEWACAAAGVTLKRAGARLAPPAASGENSSG